jgi:hypothetical protein
MNMTVTLTLVIASEAKQSIGTAHAGANGLLRRFAPRNDENN